MNRSQPASALHPERIRKALKFLRSENPLKIDPTDILHIHESAIAALELVQKGQQAVGITSNVADAGAALVKLIGALQSQKVPQK